jgi:hypothetical protein
MRDYGFFGGIGSDGGGELDGVGCGEGEEFVCDGFKAGNALALLASRVSCR